MMMLWAWAGVPLSVYNIVEDFNIALRIQPQILTLLSLITWVQCYYYQKVCLCSLCLCCLSVLSHVKQNWHTLRCVAAFIPLVCLMGSVEAALIVALRIAR